MLKIDKIFTSHPKIGSHQNVQTIFRFPPPLSWLRQQNTVWPRCVILYYNDDKNLHSFLNSFSFCTRFFSTHTRPCLIANCTTRISYWQFTHVRRFLSRSRRGVYLLCITYSSGLYVLVCHRVRTKSLFYVRAIAKWILVVNVSVKVFNKGDNTISGQLSIEVMQVIVL